MPIPAERRRSHLARDLGTMTLSCVRVDNPMALVRAAAWSNAMARLGIHLPLFLLHDFGVLFTMPRGAGGWTIRTREDQLARVTSPPVTGVLDDYRRLITDVSPSEVVEKLAGMRLRDELVAVLLTRVLSDAYHRWRDRGKNAGREPLPLDLGLYTDVDPAEHFREFDPRPLWGLLGHLDEQSRHIYT